MHSSASHVVYALMFMCLHCAQPLYLLLQAFEKFRESIGHVLAAQVDMAAADKVEMFVALMNFTGSVLPNVVSNVNEVLAAAHAALAPSGLAGDSKAERQLVALLMIPLTKYDVVTGLGLTEYPLLMGLLRHRTHKELATKIIQTIVEGGTRISSVEKVAMLFRFVSPLVKDAEDGGPGVADLDDEDVEEEQVLVARLLHSLHNDDPATHFAILATARAELMPGGPRRTRHTLPALGFCTLQVVRRLASSTATTPSDPPSLPPVTPETLLQARCYPLPCLPVPAMIYPLPCLLTPAVISPTSSMPAINLAIPAPSPEVGSGALWPAGRRAAGADDGAEVAAGCGALSIRGGTPGAACVSIL